MRIAYISFEHPAGISGGGIGTYIGQISRMMAERGHSVEVFAATKGKAFTGQVAGYRLHLIPSANNAAFVNNVLPVFEKRHSQHHFDLMESPEYGADALAIKRTYPSLPLVLKLHTPTFLVSILNGYKRGLLDKLRYIVGGLLRLQRIKFYWWYHKDTDPEYELYTLADTISSPSNSLARIIAERWGRRNINVIPNPFCANMSGHVCTKPSMETPLLITFIGRLERRKGIYDLIKAIPVILQQYPDTLIQFVGEAVPSPRKGLMMDSYLKMKLKKHAHALQFTGLLPHEHVPDIIRQSHICVFPSLWENFPNVCLEAMAEGTAVIGTNNGGMADMITHGINGLLVPPQSPDAIAKAVLHLAANRQFITELGSNARDTVLSNYNSQVIGKLTETFYNDTIAACKQ
jgi:glycogen(starch) synthase